MGLVDHQQRTSALLSLVIIAYAIMGGDDFSDRNTMPETWDIVLGALLMVLVLEAMRRVPREGGPYPARRSVARHAGEMIGDRSGRRLSPS